jgi:hypothetical protein
MRKYIIGLVAAFTALAVLPAQSAEPEQKVGVPIYDPVSKRYFALMRIDRGSDGVWDQIAKQAQRLTFKGVRGRLAIVDSLEIHQFLQQTFRPNGYQYMWIGLQYHCRARKLQWSDGRTYQRGSFQAWDRQWKQDVYFCGDTADPNDWAPVAYSPQGTWIAKGRHKGYEWYYVEYPTGKP